MSDWYVVLFLGSVFGFCFLPLSSYLEKNFLRTGWKTPGFAQVITIVLRASLSMLAPFALILFTLELLKLLPLRGGRSIVYMLSFSVGFIVYKWWEQRRKRTKY